MLCFFLGALPLYASGKILRRNLQINCEDYFSYLEYTVPKPEGKSIRSFLNLPHYVDPQLGEHSNPVNEIKRAVQFVSQYQPKGLENRPHVSLSQHRAYLLKAMFVEIARVYPYWDSKLHRNSHGDFIFSGNRQAYVMVSNPSGELSWGDNFYDVSD